MAILDIFRPRITVLQELAEKENEKNRNVMAPQSCVEFMKDHPVFTARTLISGGRQTDRLWAEYNRIIAALRKQYSVIAVICPEHGALQYFDDSESTQSDGPVCFEDGMQFGFDPMLCADHRTLAAALAKVSFGISTINYAKSDYWRFILDLLTAAYGCPDLNTFLELDHQRMCQILDDLYAKEMLTPQQYQDLYARYDDSLQVQSAAANDLCSELYPLRRSLRTMNVCMDDLCTRRGVLLLDTVPKGSHACINLILFLLKKAAQNGKMMLLTDNVNCSETDSQRKDFFESADAALPIVLGGDLPALMGPLFDNLVSNQCIKFAFTHSSGNSAEKWSQQFGVFSKKIVEYTATDNQNNTAVIEKNQGNNVAIRTEENARKVPVDQLQKLKTGRALVHLPSCSTIYQLNCPSITLAQMKERLCSKKN